MNSVKKAILDTNIYIGHWEEGRYAHRLAICRKRYIIRSSSVILHELRRRAKTKEAIKSVEKLKKLSQKILNPTEKNWWESAKIVQKIAEKEGWEKRKMQEFQNDVLIALIAHENGMILITNNRKDFELIKSVLRFALEIW